MKNNPMETNTNTNVVPVESENQKETKKENEMTVKRAGVIPYIITNDTSGKAVIKTLFSVDRKTGELSDFGGGVKKGETPFLAAKRELYEESNGILKLGDEKDHPKLPIYHRDCVIYLIPTSPFEWRNIRTEFSKKENKEVSDIVWVDLDSVLNNRVQGVWEKIKRIILKNKNLLSYGTLKNLYSS